MINLRLSVFADDRNQRPEMRDDIQVQFVIARVAYCAHVVWSRDTKSERKFECQAVFSFFSQTFRFYNTEFDGWMIADFCFSVDL